MAGKYDDNKYMQLVGINPPDTEVIATTVKSGKDLYGKSAKKFLKGHKGNKSIIGMASKNVYEFPVFVSDSVQLDFAEATCSLLEQLYASQLEVAISMNPIISHKDAEDGRFLSKYMTNTSKYLEYTDISFAHDACHNEITSIDGSTVFEFDVISIEDDEAEIINEHVSYGELGEFDHFFAEAYTPDLPEIVTWDQWSRIYNPNRNPSREVEERENYARYRQVADAVLNEKVEHNNQNEQRRRDMEDAAEQRAQHQDARAQAQEGRAQRQEERDQAQERRAEAKEQRDILMHRRQLADLGVKIRKGAVDGQKVMREINKLDADLANIEGAPSYVGDVGNKRLKNAADARKAQLDVADVNDSSYSGEVYNRRRKLSAEAAMKETDKNWQLHRYQMEKNKDARERMAHAPEIMDETKIRKLNTMKPYLMKVQLRVKNPDGDVTEYPIEFLCGVKVNCRLIKSSTLPDVAKFPIKEMNELTRKIKYKAGELKFFKDLVFNIKEKKQTAIDSKNPERKWYRRLYQLAHMKGDSFVAKQISGNSRTGLIPNATLIISENDVEMVKSETEIDLLKGSTAAKFCKELFMMALIVVDQDRESLKMMIPDTHNEYVVYSLAAVQKQLAELSTAGTKTRDLFKLLG